MGTGLVVVSGYGLYIGCMRLTQNCTHVLIVVIPDVTGRSDIHLSLSFSS